MIHVQQIRSNKDLFTYNSTHGNEPEYVFFWGGIFSQWYPSMFTTAGVTYYSAEHYMMAQKALTFGDKAIYDDILVPGVTPSQAKQLGKKVANFDDEQWNIVKFNIVVMGNILKFSQNPNLIQYLLSTNGKVIVEASAYDKVWGIGLSEDNPKVHNSTNWDGENLLGYAIMETRSIIANTLTYTTLQEHDHVSEE